MPAPLENSRLQLCIAASLAIHAALALPAFLKARGDASPTAHWVVFEPITRAQIDEARARSEAPSPRAKPKENPDSDTTGTVARPSADALLGAESATYLEALRAWFTQQSRAEGSRFPAAGGQVRMRLTIGAEGRIQGAAVVRSSGDERLDQALLRWMERLPPFTPPPSALGPPPVALEVPLIVPRRYGSGR